MFEQEDDWPEEGRFLVLYAMSNFTGHFCGLVYDQETHLCIISPTIYETDIIFEQEVWYPLETALEFWLSQIRKGRIATPPKVPHKNYVYERFDPWEFIPYNDTMLEENIDAFNRLVESIEARMPPTASTTEVAKAVHGLVDSSVLQATELPQRFAYEFVRRTRRPRFQMIAPGLEVLTDSALFDQTGGDSHVDLYRPGHQPLENHHEQSLVDVLKNWRGMVERGDWQIDENGVAGGMDVWREADSEEKWEAYVLPRAMEGVDG
ncbi:unnamed protein product [Alternaria sp. RS040]